MKHLKAIGRGLIVLALAALIVGTPVAIVASIILAPELLWGIIPGLVVLLAWWIGGGDTDAHR